MKEIFKKTIKRSVKKEVKTEVPVAPKGFDPDLPANKQREYR